MCPCPSGLWFPKIKFSPVLVFKPETHCVSWTFSTSLDDLRKFNYVSCPQAFHESYGFFLINMTFIDTLSLNNNEKSKQPTQTTSFHNRLRQSTAITNSDNQLPQPATTINCHNQLQQRAPATSFHNRIRQSTAITNSDNELQQPASTTGYDNLLP
jgi:hypothetical protein